jgi:hypothetical protein
MIDTDKLVIDLTLARKAALEAVVSRRDGGTCCLDHPVIKVPAAPEVLQAIRAAGFEPGAAYGIYAGYVSLDRFPGSLAQGSLRTVGARAVADFLVARGWTAAVFSQMD